MERATSAGGLASEPRVAGSGAGGPSMRRTWSESGLAEASAGRRAGAAQTAGLLVAGVTAKRPRTTRRAATYHAVCCSGLPSHRSVPAVVAFGDGDDAPDEPLGGLGGGLARAGEKLDDRLFQLEARVVDFYAR